MGGLGFANTWGGVAIDCRSNMVTLLSLAPIYPNYFANITFLLSPLCTQYAGMIFITNRTSPLRHTRQCRWALTSLRGHAS